MKAIMLNRIDILLLNFQHVLKVVLKVTSGTCSTRFTSSQYVEFRKLADSLPLFIKTFRQFKYTQIKEYMIAGKDFVLDFCDIWDILEPIITVLVESQKISLPCWKIVVWWPVLKNHLEEIRLSLESKCYDFLPLLLTNLGDLKKMKFKDVSLVDGWMEVSSETIESSESFPTNVSFLESSG